MRRLGLTLITAACCVSAFLGSSMTVRAEDGPNTPQPFVLTENQPFNGTAVVSNRRFNQDYPDVYRFTIPSSGQVTLTAESIEFRSRFSLFDEFGTRLKDNNGDERTVVQQSDTKSVTYSLDKGSYYFLADDDSYDPAINSLGDCKYRIRKISFKPVEEDFAEVQDGVNNNLIDDANEITPGSDINGMLSAAETRDFYKLTLPQSGRLTLTTKSSQIAQYDINLLSDSGVSILKQTVTRNNGVGNATYRGNIDLLAGTYYVCFESNYYRGQYSFSNSLNPANESKEVMESVTDMNDSIDTASKVESGKEYYAQIGHNEVSDFYEFTMVSKGKPHLYLNGDMEYVTVTIFTASERDIWYANNGLVSGVNVIDKEIDSELDVGTYYLEVSKNSESTGNYRFKLTLPARQNQKGDVLSDAKGNVYKITSATTVTYVKPKNNKQTSVKVPDSVTLNNVKYKVTAISAKAFKDNKKLTTLTVGKNVATIGDSAMQGATKLKKLDLSKTNVKTIGKNAMKDCKALTDLKINGNKVKTIKTGALKNGNKKRVITILAKNKKTYDTAVTKVTKAGAAKNSCKQKKSNK